MSASTSLNVVINAKDEASDTLKKVGGATEGLKSTLMTFAGVAAAAFSAEKIIEFGKQSFEAFEEAQASATRTGQVIGNTLDNMSVKTINAFQKMADAAGGPGTDVFEYASAAIDKAAKSAVQMGFDDEDAAESISKFFQRTQDLTQAQNLSAVAMDLARAKNIDLASATVLVNQVLSGNGKVLKQYGIDIKDSATPLQALGQLHEQVAGQAAAFAQTTAGKMQILSTEYGNFQEVVGGLIADALTPLLGFMTSIFGSLQDLGSIQGNLTAFFAAIDQQTGLISLLKQSWDELVSTFENTLMPSLKKLWDALQPLMPFMKAMAEVIGIAIVIAVGALILGLKILIEMTMAVLNVFIEWETFLVKVYSVVINGVIDGIANMILLWTQFRDTVKVVMDEVAAFIKPVVDAITSMVSALSKAASAASSVASAVGKTVSSAVSSVAGHKAGGGAVFGGSTYLVGESGPELFTPSMSGSIIPNGAMSGGGGMTVNILGGTYLSEDSARILGDMILDQLKMKARL